MHNNTLIIIGGPTAVGKTEVSIKLAKKLNGEIISCDSMQIYKHMDIGSAKATKEERGDIPHNLIDIIEPFESFSVSDFKNLALKEIKRIQSEGKVPIVVGGTGLYINSLIYDFSFTEAKSDEEYRKYLNNLAEEKGREYIYNMLKDVDEITASKLHFNNLKRVIRALEVYKITNKPFSSFEEPSPKLREDFNIYYYVLNGDRAKLYDRINQRVDIMFEQGLLEEVENLKSMGCNTSMQSMKGIGYKEVLQYLDHLITFDECKDMIKQGSRNYAKRQLTWFRRSPEVNWINVDEFNTRDEIVDYIKSNLNV